MHCARNGILAGNRFSVNTNINRLMNASVRVRVQVCVCCAVYDVSVLYIPVANWFPEN